MVLLSLKSTTERNDVVMMSLFFGGKFIFFKVLHSEVKKSTIIAQFNLHMNDQIMGIGW